MSSKVLSVRRTIASLLGIASAVMGQTLFAVPSIATPVTYASTVLADGPSFYYRLGDAPATPMPTAADSSGHGNNGTYQAAAGLGAAGALPSDLDTAVTGDGSGAILLADGTNLPWGSANRTVELWEKTTSTAEQALVSYGEAYSGGMLFTLTMTGSATGSSMVTLHDSSSDPAWSTPVALADGNWHHIVFSYASPDLTLYVDGVTAGLISLGVYPLGTGVHYTAEQLFVGADTQNRYAKFAGSLDELAIYPTALTPTQVDAHLAISGYPPAAPATVTASAGTDPGTLAVTWDASAGASASAYDVQVQSSGGVVDSARVAAGSACASSCSTVLTGISATGGPYTVSVSGHDAWGDGPATTSSPVTPSSASTYRDAVLGDAPSYYYRLDARNDGDVASDSSGGGNAGVLQPAAGLSVAGALPSDADTALTGDGSGPVIVADGTNLPWNSSNRTVELWEKTTSTAEQSLVSYGEAYSDRMLFTLTMTGSASGSSTVTLHDSSSDPTWTVPVALADGAWHHIVLSYASPDLTLYVDGVTAGLISLGVYPLATGVHYIAEQLFVGSDTQNRYAKFTGSLDELAIYPSALTPAQVDRHLAVSGYAPSVPSNVTANAGAGAGSLDVTWSPSSSGTPTSYDVTARDSLGNTVDSARVNAATACSSGPCSTTLDGVSASGAPYTVDVAGRNAWGDGLTNTSGGVTPVDASGYRDAVMAPGPSFYYRLDARNDGDKAADVSGHANDGVLQPADSLSVAGALSGDADTAISGDGSGPIVLADGTNLPWSATPRTIDLWAKTTSTAQQGLVSYGEAYSSGMLFTLTMTGATSGSSVVTLVDSGSDPAWSVPVALADGNWHHIALTYDGATTLTLYVDGTSVGIKALGSLLGTGVYYSTKELFVGADEQNRFAHFHGSLDEVAIYPTALNSTQIQQQYAAGTAHMLTTSIATGATDGTGAVNDNTGAISCQTGAASGPCASAYASGTAVTLTATPDASNYEPLWTGCPSVSVDGSQCTVTVNSDIAISVEFVQFYTLTVSADSGDGSATGAVVSTVGSINCPSVTCTEKVPYDGSTPGTVSLNALPDGSSYLSGWSGCIDGSQLTCQVTLDADKTVHAVFLSCPTGFTCSPFTGPDTNFSGVCPVAGTTNGNSLVTLTGHNLMVSDQVLFDGVPATSVSAAPDGTSLTVKTPTHGAGSVQVTIQNLQGTSGTTFTYQDVPAQLTDIGPSSVYHVGASPVTLSGTNLFDVTGISTDSLAGTNITSSCDGTSVTFTPADDNNPSDTSQTVSVTTAAGAANNTLTLTRTDPLSQGSTSDSYVPETQFLLDSSSATVDQSIPYSAPDGTSITATVPAGDLPVGTRIDVYKVDPSNEAALTSSLPAGSVVQGGYAVAWTAPDGTHPVPTTPIDVQIDDPSIPATPAVYAAGDDGSLTSLALTATVPAGVDKLAVVSGSDQHIVDLIDVTPGQLLTGAQVIAAGGGNVIAAGGGNLVFAGGFVIAAGGGNVIAAGGGNVIAAGGGNVIAAGGGNFSVLAATASALAQINSMAAGVIAAGGGNFDVSSMINVSGAGFAQMSMPYDPQLVMVQAPTAPDAPGTPSATVSGTDVTVSWVAPAASDPAVSAYSMQIFTDGTQTANVVFADASTTQTITNLARGHSYAFTVEAYNGSYSAASVKSASVSIPALSGGGGGTSSSGVSRVAGSTRIGTAIAVSQKHYAAANSASAVALARADVFADALAGGPLAAKVGGPLLLTGSASLDASTSTEIQRVLPTGGTVYVLGGTNAISASVDSALQTLGYQVKRLAGSTRAGTAVQIATAMGSPNKVFLVTGANFPDGLAAGPAAITSGGVVLLTDGTTPDPVTAAYLASLTSPTVTAVGGPACQADPQATCLKGADRYATAEAVAAEFFTAPSSAGVATGTSFPDALAAVPYLGATLAPLLLVQPEGTLPAPVTTYLAAKHITTATIFGGTAAISDDVLTEVSSATGG